MYGGFHLYITVTIPLDGVRMNIGKLTAHYDGVYSIKVYCLTTF